MSTSLPPTTSTADRPEEQSRPVPHGPENEATNERAAQVDLHKYFGLPPGAPISFESYPDTEPGKKPPYNYEVLVKLAIFSSPQQKLTFEEICEALKRNYKWFRDRKVHYYWMKEVALTLCSNADFVKHMADPNQDRKAKIWWTVDFTYFGDHIYLFERKMKSKRSKPSSNQSGDAGSTVTGKRRTASHNENHRSRMEPKQPKLVDGEQHSIHADQVHNEGDNLQPSARSALGTPNETFGNKGKKTAVQAESDAIGRSNRGQGHASRLPDSTGAGPRLLTSEAPNGLRTTDEEFEEFFLESADAWHAISTPSTPAPEFDTESISQDVESPIAIEETDSGGTPSTAYVESYFEDEEGSPSSYYGFDIRTGVHASSSHSQQVPQDRERTTSLHPRQNSEASIPAEDYDDEASEHPSLDRYQEDLRNPSPTYGSSEGRVYMQRFASPTDFLSRSPTPATLPAETEFESECD